MAFLDAPTLLINLLRCFLAFFSPSPSLPGRRGRPPPRCRRAGPSWGRARAEVWGGKGGDRRGPGLPRRDRPRPLLPAGEDLKQPGEARSPALGSPDPRAQAPRLARSRSLRCSRRREYRDGGDMGMAMGRGMWDMGMGMGSRGSAPRGRPRCSAVGAGADGGSLPPACRCRAP